MRLSVRTFPFQRKAACSFRSLRYLKEASRNVGLMTGRKDMNKNNVGKVMEK